MSVSLIAIFSFAACIANQRLWDDDTLLSERMSPVNLSADVPTAVSRIWTEPYWGRQMQIPDTYRPFASEVLYAEVRAFGEWMAGFRIVSLLLHAAVCLALLRVLGLVAPPPVAWISALLFAAHPIHGEAVAMAYGQLELLAALFTLLAMERYIAAMREPPRRSALAASLGFAFLSVCSKESGLMLPALLVLLRGCYLANDQKGIRRWLTWREVLFVLPGLAYLAMRRLANGSLFPPAETTVTFGYPALVRLKAVVVSIGNLVRLTLFPTGQSLYYGHLRDHILGHPWTEVTWILTGIVLLWMLAPEVGLRDTVFGSGWFLILVFPVSNVIPSGVVLAERNLYLPVAGAVFLLARHLNKMNRRALFVVPVLLLVCMLDSNYVVSRWRSNEVLWRSTVAMYPRSPMAYVWLGQTLVGSGDRDEEAQTAFAQAYDLNPNLAGASHGLGVIAMRRHDYLTAINWFESAQKLEPRPATDAEIADCRRRLAESR